LGTHYEQGDPVVEGGRHPLYTQVATDSDWLRIACGHSYALARKSNGSLWAWGRNDHGQLGQGNQSNDPYFGANDSDTPLLVDPLGGRWLEIACGPFHALASTVDGKLYAWGWNRSKQCGDAGAGDVLLPHLVMSL
jgi:alpha-tubulin suppressor-like RCC1 family protein